MRPSGRRTWTQVSPSRGRSESAGRPDRQSPPPSCCTGYYNYFVDSNYASGSLHDPVGFALPAAGGYRYSTNDLGAAMIRVDALGETIWLFVADSCIAAQLPSGLNNEND